MTEHTGSVRPAFDGPYKRGGLALSTLEEVMEDLPGQVAEPGEDPDDEYLEFPQLRRRALWDAMMDSLQAAPNWT